jgi:hypothetical protein
MVFGQQAWPSLNDLLFILPWQLAESANPSFFANAKPAWLKIASVTIKIDELDLQSPPVAIVTILLKTRH